MHHTLRIKKDDRRRLVLEVVSSSGALLARTTPYPTICKLEVGLSVLAEAAEAAGTVTFDEDNQVTRVGPRSRRTRIALEGRVEPSDVLQMLEGIPSSLVVDERSPSERRFELSGRLQDLIR
jgi:hypothetical protein